MTSMIRPTRQLRRRPHRAESKALTKGDLELRNGTPEENLLHHLRQTTISLRKRLSTQEAALSLDEKKEFLAHFNQACEKYIRIRGKWPSKVEFGDVLWLLRAPLLSREKEIRASAIRLLRYFLNTPGDVDVFIQRGMAALIVRILDNNNDDPAYEDRVQALKLIRKLLKIVPKHLPRALVITLVTIINNSLRNDTHDTAEKRTLPVRDKLYRPCIEILCEISFAAPTSVIEVGGFRVLLDAVLDKTITGTSPNISESMVITILHLIQFMPNVSADYHLSYLISPHFEKGKHSDCAVLQAPTCSGVQYNASRLALTSLLRNWRGLANLCHGRFNNSISELLAIFCCNLEDTILLDSLLTLLFDVFNIRSCQEQELEEIEEKSEECSTIFDDLVAASQKLDYDDEQEFSLAQNFLVAESRYKESIYETDGTYFDLSQSFKILILAIFLEARLVEHLIELITNAQSEVVAAKGGLLLAEIDVLTSLYLPAHCVSNSVLSETKLSDKAMLVLATSEIITSRLTHIVNEEGSTDRGQRRAHQAIMWLKNYRRLRKASFQQSIYLQHQIKLRTQKPKPIFSVPVPTPAPTSSNTSSRRSSLGIFNITKSKTTANIFDNTASSRKSFGKRSLIKWSKKAASVGSTPKSPTKGSLERQPSEDSENAFLISLEDLQLDTSEYTPDWLVLSRKLKEFMDEKMSEIFPHGDDTLETTNGIKVQDIVDSIRGHLINPHWADENVEWGPLWTEKEEVGKKIECAECFISFLGTLCLYFQARRTTCSRLFEWSIEIIDEILNHYYEKLVEMTRESPFILRQQLTSQNCLFIRYFPLLYSYIVCDSNIKAIGAIRPGMKRMMETIKFQINDLGKCFKRRNSSSSSDSVMLDDDNCPLEKLILSAFDFSQPHCRPLFEDIADSASDHLKNYLSELVLFWVEAKAEWIVKDKWLYLQTLSLVRQSPQQSDTALVAFQQFIRIPKIANYALQELGMIMEFDLSLRQKVLCVLVENEFIAQKVEEFGGVTDLDSMLDNWMTTGQYEFSKEIIGRLKVSFSTSDVKDYEKESVPRRSVLSRNIVRPVHLPHNLLHSLASHTFGVERLKDYVKELVIQLNQPVASDLPESELDRLSALWSAGAILSTNFGCNVFSSQLWPLVIKNLKHEWLPIRATAFYVVNWISRSPYGADLIEYETNLSWKVKKRLVGDIGRRQRNSTVDSWSSSTFPDDSFKDLYIDSSNASLNDPFQSTDGINRSNEHLVHSISRLLDQNRPLIVSISRQWSMNDELESGKTPLYREQRSISDTTAMELTISRHQSFDSSSPMSPMKSRLLRPVTRTHRVLSSASSGAEMPSVPEGKPLEEPLVSQSLNETKLQRNLPFFNRFTTDAETFAATNGHITRPSHFASEMRKSRTEPSLGSFATYQSSEGHSTAPDPGEQAIETFDNEIYRVTPPEYPGIALPNDLMSFLDIPEMNSAVDTSSIEVEKLPQKETILLNSVENSTEAECDESVEIFSEVLQLVREASRGKGEIPKRIFHLRTKHVESFRNLRLYEQVINRLVETSAIGVTNFRKHVHELFDWRSVDQTSTKNLFFHEIEEQMSEIDKKWTAAYPALIS